MPSFKFECEHRTAWDSTLEVRHTTECEYEQLDDVIGAFQDFLRGCGYYFDGNLEIVPNQAVEKVNAVRESLCVVCKLPKSVMEHHQCFDKHCPKIGCDGC